MRVPRYADECALCHKVIYTPASISMTDEYCGICAIHLELSAILEILEEMREFHFPL
jgi:hypothetical protein